MVACGEVRGRLLVVSPEQDVEEALQAPSRELPCAGSAAQRVTVDLNGMSSTLVPTRTSKVPGS